MKREMLLWGLVWSLVGCSGGSGNGPDDFVVTDDPATGETAGSQSSSTGGGVMASTGDPSASSSGATNGDASATGGSNGSSSTGSGSGGSSGASNGTGSSGASAGSNGSGTGGATGSSTGGATAGSTGSSGSNSGSTGSSTGGSTGATTGGSTGATTGGATGSSTGASTGGSSGASTGANTGANTGGPVVPALVDGCASQKLRAGIPEDLSKPGPWPVGAITTTLNNVRTEVWYPAKFGSEAGKTKVVYELEDQLPASEKGKIPAARRPSQTCNCYRSLPIDAEAGPYPVLVFVHGTAGFRTTNLENVQHWASRGFVVVAQDHPGIRLGDMVTLSGGNTDQAGDARRALTSLSTPSGDIAFLKDRIDMKRVGVMGHSAGAQAVSGLGDVADVIIPYAGGAAITKARVLSAMFVTGDKDSVVAPSTNGYDGTTTKPKRRVWIKGGGHLVGGSLCVIRDPTDPNKDIVDLANEFQIGNLLLRPFFGNLFDGCNDPPDSTSGKFIPASRGIEIMNFVTTGQFEEALHCSKSATAQLATTQMKFGADVAQYAATLP